MIKIENLHKNYGQLEVLKGINCEFKKGEVVAIIGPSGSGKSTFLRCINALESASSGHIYIDGVDITAKTCNINKIRTKISMVFQHFNLFANKSVLENLTLAPIKTGLMGKDEAKEHALNLLKKVGLKDKAGVYPHKLSGGQKQRVAIARALAMNPQAILFDEPTSALDPEMIGEVLSLIKDVANEGMSMLVVTHEMGFAKNVSNRLIFMDGGYIASDCSPHTAFGDNPPHPRLREFLNKILNH